MTYCDTDKKTADVTSVCCSFSPGGKHSSAWARQQHKYKLWEVRWGVCVCTIKCWLLCVSSWCLCRCFVDLVCVTTTTNGFIVSVAFNMQVYINCFLSCACMYSTDISMCVRLCVFLQVVRGHCLSGLCGPPTEAFSNEQQMEKERQG